MYACVYLVCSVDLRVVTLDDHCLLRLNPLAFRAFSVAFYGSDIFKLLEVLDLRS